IHVFDSRPVWHAKTPIHLPSRQLVICKLTIPASPRINRLIIARMRSAQRRYNVSPRTNAWINEVARAKFFEGHGVAVQPATLKNRLAVPPKSEPSQVFGARLHKLGSATPHIQIIDAQQQFAAVRARSLLRGPKRT